MTDDRLERIAEVIYQEWRVGKMPDYQPMWHELDRKPGPIMAAARRILEIADGGERVGRPALWEGVCEDGHVHEWTERTGVIRERCVGRAESDNMTALLPRICGKPLTVRVIGYTRPAIEGERVEGWMRPSWAENDLTALRTKGRTQFHINAYRDGHMPQTVSFRRATLILHPRDTETSE